VDTTEGVALGVFVGVAGDAMSCLTT